jgi:Xaa-Pro aminopeptidase
VEQRDPATIGINTSELFSHADGLSSSEKSALIEALGAKYAARLRSAEALAVGWLEVKLRGETEAYRLAVRIAHEIIAEAFSSRVIAPGVSTTGDVVWWMRQRVASLGLGQWFQPSVTIWRQGGVAQPPPPEGHVIERGDFLHCDFGIVYLGFSTDTQQNAYVLRTGETDAPAGLRAGLRDAGRLQDITMQCARAGVSGNAALSCALAQARREGLAPSIYCHPIGYHGHGAGPPIGMTDYQDGVPGRGEYLLRAATWHSIELNVTHAVPEWGNEQIRVALEEDAALLDEGWSWIDGRQTALHLIR